VPRWLRVDWLLVSRWARIDWLLVLSRSVRALVTARTDLDKCPSYGTHRPSYLQCTECVCFRTESGVLSSFYNYFTLADTPQQRGPSPEDQEAIERAHRCIQECHVEQLIMESKFLRVDSLQELLKVVFCLYFFCLGCSSTMLNPYEIFDREKTKKIKGFTVYLRFAIFVYLRFAWMANSVKQRNDGDQK